MSQIFDSLRRDRSPQPRPNAPRTAQGDAVLATLGYAPVSRRRRSSAALVRVALVLGVLAVSWAGWRIYDRSAPVSSPLRNPPLSSSVPRPLPSDPPRLPSVPAPARGSNPTPLNAQPSGVPQRASRAPASAIPDRHVQSRVAAPPPLPSVSGPQSSATATPPPPRGVTGSTPGPRQPAASLARPAAATSIASATAVNDLDLALYYHRAGDFENALQHYRALLQRNELNAQAHNNLGLLYQEKNLLQESARELQRAILIEPRNAGARNNYGVTLLMQGKPDEATAQFRSVLALDPQNLDALVNLALAQRAGGQLDVARETLLGALMIAPRNAAAHYNLGQLYDQTNEPARAVEHYRKFLETAGAEHATRAAAVRARIAALSRTPE